jgi:hypothetical protein
MQYPQEDKLVGLESVEKKVVREASHLPNADVYQVRVGRMLTARV